MLIDIHNIYHVFVCKSMKTDGKDTFQFQNGSYCQDAKGMAWDKVTQVAKKGF